VHPGTVAVDPQVVRLGSHLWIPGYGRGHAEDTGGVIHGFHIDLWMGSCVAARRWGVRRLRVSIRR
jgi:3D (Asp-Asp-Asp) domain-containing protein